MRVVVTQAEPGAARTVARLREAGLDAIAHPLLRVEPIAGAPVAAGAYDWLVFTSRNGVEAALPRLCGPLPRIAVVGPGTAEAARARGLEPDVVAAVSTQEGLAAAFPRSPGRVLFLGAEGARDVLVRELGAEFVPVYRTVPRPPEPFPDADLVALASGSAARAFAAAAVALPCVSIGPVTSAVARDHGVKVVAEAETHDLDGLLQAVRLAASRIASSPS